MKTVYKVICSLMLILIIATPATALEVKNVTVIPSNNGVIVKVNYTLDPFTALKVFFFGAKTIENDVLSIFNASKNFTILRIGYSSAEFLFPAEKCGNTTYFSGVDLNVTTNVTICAKTPILMYTNEIPPIYYNLS